mmetsp:Transcript_57626/g.108003  ORF Transcript_57626/g.108003 Transcript_57626/m.108003 type:complete len:133 (+) Transcript_57626:1529-1927(+)
MLSSKLGNAVAEHTIVKVLATQMRISSCGLHFENCIRDGQDRYIKGAAAHVEHQNVRLFCGAALLILRLCIQAICNGCSSGLIDNSHHVQARNFASIFSSLPLRVVEVSRHSNHSVSNSLTHERLSRLLHLG